MAPCSSTVPVVNFNFCDPKVKFGQIKRVYIAREDFKFTNVTNLTEWTAALSDTGTTGTEVRTLYTTGDKPAPTKNEVEVSGRRKVYGAKDHVLNVAIDDISDENYAFMQSVEGGKRVYKMWYEDYNGHMYGGNDGIRVSVDFDHIIPGGAGDVQTLSGVMQWTAKIHPNRTLSPLAD